MNSKRSLFFFFFCNRRRNNIIITYPRLGRLLRSFFSQDAQHYLSVHRNNIIRTTREISTVLLLLQLKRYQNVAQSSDITVQSISLFRIAPHAIYHSLSIQGDSGFQTSFVSVDLFRRSLTNVRALIE